MHLETTDFKGLGSTYLYSNDQNIKLHSQVTFLFEHQILILKEELMPPIQFRLTLLWPDYNFMKKLRCLAFTIRKDSKQFVSGWFEGEAVWYTNRLSGQTMWFRYRQCIQSHSSPRVPWETSFWSFTKVYQSINRKCEDNFLI